ncbi:protein farnesyltransferase/geranylgeranyltransferase type-1 subunit alpha-like isoform X3 [Corticium candelabrum]|uniref:protein farnesyltransferase/geranylgeranyltransferase type-1 subunit alpha-like isoform X3 n=1 Tax=Corticium candelabrum TaxID=121492 RepID=UPI002E26A572|nr:protein farnesyltransferase/geranylgeranyltransferase type-1 subunit alpha-like isoform X3 [Corticium candelabrum]
MLFRYHRRILIEWIGDPSGELDFAEEILENDAKNYHTWSHRQWLIKQFHLWDGELDYVDSYVLGFIKKAPNNESAWNYLSGILDDQRKSTYGSLKEICLGMLSDHIRSPHLLSFLVDTYEEEALDSKNMCREESLSQAIQLCRQLGSDVDTIRRKYWDYRGRKLEQKSRELQTDNDSIE